jgi:hypothetical protein
MPPATVFSCFGMYIVNSRYLFFAPSLGQRAPTQSSGLQQGLASYLVTSYTPKVQPKKDFVKTLLSTTRQRERPGRIVSNSFFLNCKLKRYEVPVPSGSMDQPSPRLRQFPSGKEPTHEKHCQKKKTRFNGRHRYLRLQSKRTRVS